MKLRYPGSRPFEIGQQHLFFGRNTDINNLYRFIKLESLIVLYGKSGTGKSSLLNAGIIPRATKDGYFATTRVRFNACPPAGETAWQKPLETTFEALRSATSGTSNAEFLDSIISGEASIWLEIKKYQLATDGQKGILMIFDQFEELFTYPASDILDFRRQLAEALYTPVPQRFWDALEHGHNHSIPALTPAQLSIFQNPPHVKIVLTIRSDRMHLLHQMTDYIPSILKNCYELGPLDDSQAIEAILNPALLPGDFTVPPFTFDPQALSMVMEFLTDNRRQRAELTQLQIISNYIERKAGENNWSVISPEYLKDLDGIIENYYFDKLEQITDPQQQAAARRLIEEGLLFEEEERRLNLYEGQIYRIYSLGPEILRQLVDSHLLRAEPSMQGGYTYELSHDSLVGPVLKAKNKRLLEERALADELANAERGRELALERRKRLRTLRVAVVMTILSVLSLSGLLFGTVQYRQARISERAAIESLNRFLSEKREKERLQVTRIVADAETLYKAWQAQPELEYLLGNAIGKLHEALAIDTANTAVKNKIEEYEKWRQSQ